MISLRGKSLTAVCKDISDGYVAVNPIFLKPLDAETLKGLIQEIMKLQAVIRTEKFPYKDLVFIRYRNMKLQRLHNSLMVIRNFAKERGLRQIL